MRTVLHVDMDAFFAAIEQQRRPEVRGRPVVVGGRGDPHGRGVVSTASYEARAYGIGSGMPLAEAYRRCPEAVFLPVDHERYAGVSRRIKAVLRDFSPIVEDVGLDEAFLELPAQAPAPEETARAIKRRVRAETGLACSVGIAPNKLLAKIASDLGKPDGLVHIAEHDVERVLWPLPVRAIRGIGPKTQARLAGLGVRTVGELAQVPLATLVALFGRARGLHCHRSARGIDNRPLVTQRRRKSIGRETTFTRDLADPGAVRERLRDLLREVLKEARAAGVRARTVEVKLRFGDFRTVSRQATLAAVRPSDAELERAAVGCLARIPPDGRVRLVGVRLGGFAGRDAEELADGPSRPKDFDVHQ